MFHVTCLLKNRKLRSYLPYNYLINKLNLGFIGNISVCFVFAKKMSKKLRANLACIFL